MQRWALIFALATRNFWRQRRRNTSLLIAVAIGMAATLAGGFLIRGWQMSSIAEAVDNLGGTIVVQHADWSAKPEPRFSVALDATNRQRLNDLDRPWLARIRANVSLSSERETRGAELHGIDVAAELEQTVLARYRIDGAWPDAESTNAVVVGAALVADLETRLGKRIVLMTQDAQERRAEIGLTIVGVFHAPTEAAERARIFMPRQAVERLLNMTGRASEIVISTPDLLRTEAATEAVAAAFPTARVRDWRGVQPTIWAMYQLTEGMVVIWQMIFLAALAFGLVNTLVAAVLERTREFGLLQAVGMRPRAILQQVLVESWLILLAGLIVGGVIAALIYLWLADGIDVAALAPGMDVPGMTRPLYPIVQAVDVVSLIGVIALFGFFASLYPARRAVALDPITALNRH
ncbi:MAG: FtsX-like permease family protein [Pseudomonadota bacterium]